MGENKKTPITIDDKEYIFENMTDEQKQLVNHVADLDRKITSSQFNLEQLQFGRLAFIEKLKGCLGQSSMETLIHDAWVLFVALGSFLGRRLTQKIDNLEKRLDQLRFTAIERGEYKQDVYRLHARCNELEKTKASVAQTVEVKLKKDD